MTAGGALTLNGVSKRYETARGALPAVEELAKEVEAQYKLPLT